MPRKHSNLGLGVIIAHHSSLRLLPMTPFCDVGDGGISNVNSVPEILSCMHVIYFLVTLCAALQLKLSVDHIGFEKTKHQISYPEKLPKLSIQKNEKIQLKAEVQSPKQFVLSLEDQHAVTLVFKPSGSSYSLTIVQMID
jgi:hypothetical protein